MERPGWDPLSLKIPLEMVIQSLNQRLSRWSDLIARIQQKRILALTATGTITTSHDIIEVNTTGGAVTLNVVPLAQHAQGHVFYINHHTGGNNVVFDPNGAETVDGGATATFTGRRAYYSNGTEWKRLY
jgi:hypothetical protein